MTFYLISRCEKKIMIKGRIWYFFSMCGFYHNTLAKGVYVISACEKSIDIGEDYLLDIGNAIIKREYVYGKIKSLKRIDTMKRDFL
jgi:hypothetical protein